MHKKLYHVSSNAIAAALRRFLPESVRRCAWCGTKDDPGEAFQARLGF